MDISVNLRQCYTHCQLATLDDENQIFTTVKPEMKPPERRTTDHSHRPEWKRPEDAGDPRAKREKAGRRQGGRRRWGAREGAWRSQPIGMRPMGASAETKRHDEPTAVAEHRQTSERGGRLRTLGAVMRGGGCGRSCW